LSDKEINFVPSGRGKARCAPDPAYPKGIAVALPEGVVESCFVELPYPAPECGAHVVICKTCHSSAIVTAAGRADDPVSFFMPCFREGRS
jgi:hypothetical protein